jgi:hypothetical protein
MHAYGSASGQGELDKTQMYILLEVQSALHAIASKLAPPPAQQHNPDPSTMVASDYAGNACLGILIDLYIIITYLLLDDYRGYVDAILKYIYKNSHIHCRFPVRGLHS